MLIGGGRGGEGWSGCARDLEEFYEESEPRLIENAAGMQCLLMKMLIMNLKLCVCARIIDTECWLIR